MYDSYHTWQTTNIVEYLPIFLRNNQHLILFADSLLHIGITEIVASIKLNMSITVVKAEFGQFYEKCQLCQLPIYGTVWVLTFLWKQNSRNFLTQTKNSLSHISHTSKCKPIFVTEFVILGGSYAPGNGWIFSQMTWTTTTISGTVQRH
jgi:hypothetical protein